MRRLCKRVSRESSDRRAFLPHDRALRFPENDADPGGTNSDKARGEIDRAKKKSDKKERMKDEVEGGS